MNWITERNLDKSQVCGNWNTKSSKNGSGKKSQGKLKNTLRWMKIKIQYTKTYRMQLCSA